MDDNSLVSALAGDATTIGTTYISAQAAKSVIPKISPTMLLILVGGGIVVLFLVLKK